MLKRGFTLIELMIVVAILALFLGIAVPSYQNYMIRSRVSTVVLLMKHYAQIAQEYNEAKGVYGKAADLGFTTIPGSPEYLANPSTINRYTTVQKIDKDGQSRCYTDIRVTFNGPLLGLSQNFDIQMMLRQLDGMYQITCGIPYDQNSTTYAQFLDYFPEACRSQNVSTCAI